MLIKCVVINASHNLKVNISKKISDFKKRTYYSFIKNIFNLTIKGSSIRYSCLLWTYSYNINNSWKNYCQRLLVFIFLFNPINWSFHFRFRTLWCFGVFMNPSQSIEFTLSICWLTYFKFYNESILSAIYSNVFT